MGRPPSRRELLTGWLTRPREPVAPTARTPRLALRPPGALTPDQTFLERCTGCADCLPACPTASLVMVDSGGAQLPAIFPTLKPCYLCTTLPCIAACPEGALVDPGGPQRVRLGIARVDPNRCVTFRGQRCDHCYQICPYPDQAITLVGGRPLVNSGACTGCGLCEMACPERPRAIKVVPERDLVPGLRVPRSDHRAG